MRSFAAFATAVALGLSSAFLVACGDRNNLIPQSSASEMKADLDEAEKAVDGGHCAVAARAIERAATSADELPSGVDAALRRNLAENFKVVQERVATNCQSTTSTSTQATTPTNTSTQATTVETVPTETTTTPSPTTLPSTTPSVSGGGGNGNGNGNGGTGSGGSSGGTGSGGGLKPPTD